VVSGRRPIEKRQFSEFGNNSNELVKWSKNWKARWVGSKRNNALPVRVGKRPDERSVETTSRQPPEKPTRMQVVAMGSRKPGRQRNLHSANRNLAGTITLADQDRYHTFRDGLVQHGADGHCLVGVGGHRQLLASDDSVLSLGNAGDVPVSLAGVVRNGLAAIPTSSPDSIGLLVSSNKSAANSDKDAESACLPIHFARGC